jgi:hypothetical protein
LLVKEGEVKSSRVCFISNEEQKSSEGMQRHPLNWMIPIHAAILKAVGKNPQALAGKLILTLLDPTVQ